jgi:hypothetical protein
MLPPLYSGHHPPDADNLRSDLGGVLSAVYTLYLNFFPQQLKGLPRNNFARNLSRG